MRCPMAPDMALNCSGVMLRMLCTAMRRISGFCIIASMPAAAPIPGTAPPLPPPTAPVAGAVGKGPPGIPPGIDPAIRANESHWSGVIVFNCSAIVRASSANGATAR